ncbi:MAG: Mpo1-like protein, partial [Rubrivivax sp.]
MNSPLRNATELLTQYAAYHRDPRNIATHFVGVPMIVFGVGVLLARAGFQVGGTDLTLAWMLFALSAVWYLTRGHIGLGLATTVAVGILIALGHTVAGGSIGSWLAWGLGFFAVGWTLQFIGHYYEGRKPAFADDVIGLLVGPM